MKAFLERFSAWMDAITFAEAGEWETARQMITAERSNNDDCSFLNRVFMAVALAEEGLHDEAIRIMRKMPVPGAASGELRKTLGLKGIRMTYGVVPPKAIA